MSISFRERKAASLAVMTADQRAEYDDALEEERERLRLTEQLEVSEENMTEFEERFSEEIQPDDSSESS